MKFSRSFKAFLSGPSEELFNEKKMVKTGGQNSILTTKTKHLYQRKVAKKKRVK